MGAPSVLIVDDEQEMCSSLEEILRDEGFQAYSTTRAARVEQLLSERAIDLMVLDIRMPEIGGVDLLRSVKELRPALPVIMITGYPSIATAVRAMKYGAVNYYTKPLDLSNLLTEIRSLLARRSAAEGAHPASNGIVARDAAMMPVLENITRAAEVDAPVLITGESGTGKELVAEAIHSTGKRCGEPFIRVNCAAIPETLIESELFGHEAGAFTDARTSRKGRFELANRGTLFLDEIGDMSLSTQARILHALQEKTFERVGGGRSIRTDTRFIAATHQNLAGMIESGAFREDLFYRLAVITIHIPPLRERGDDIDLLIDHYLHHFESEYGRSISGIAPEVRRFLRRHDWPGNVRELRNCIERAVIFAQEGEISFEDLPLQYKQLIDTHSGMEGPQEEISRISREIIRDALVRSGGVKARAADLLHISRKTLYNRMKRLGIDQ